MNRRGGRTERGGHDPVRRRDIDRGRGGERVPQDVAVIDPNGHPECHHLGRAARGGRGLHGCSSFGHAVVMTPRMGAATLRFAGPNGLRRAQAQADAAEAQAEREGRGGPTRPAAGAPAVSRTWGTPLRTSARQEGCQARRQCRRIPHETHHDTTIRRASIVPARWEARPTRALRCRSSYESKGTSTTQTLRRAEARRVGLAPTFTLTYRAGPVAGSKTAGPPLSRCLARETIPRMLEPPRDASGFETLELRF